MATVSAKVYEHHKKTDGTYNVKICVHHKSERKFIDTNHYVVKKQLTKDFKIRDPFVVEKVDRQLREPSSIFRVSMRAMPRMRGMEVPQTTTTLTKKGKS